MLTLIQCLFHLCVTAVAHKRPWLFCPKCRWQVTSKHAYFLDLTKTEWADCAAAQARCGKLSGNELTRNLSGNIQLAEPLWTDPGIKSGISGRELIIYFKKTKKRRWGIMVKHSPQNLASKEKTAMVSQWNGHGVT